jgi:ferredoxin
MIIAETKPIEEIIGFLEGHKKILVAGCGGCVSVCFAGGEMEAQTVANLLRIAFLEKGKKAEIIVETKLRQCEYDLVDELVALAKKEKVDAIVSLACGVGVNLLASKIGPIAVYPGVNTTFYGGAVEHGHWVEMCAGCGDCIVAQTGGICPIARCTKSLMNGPCGGTSDDGKCEIDPDVDCGWSLIVQRMKDLKRLDELTEVKPPRDWSTSYHGGPRKLVREDITAEPEKEQADEK